MSAFSWSFFERKCLYYWSYWIKIWLLLVLVENKNVDLEEELRMIGENLKALEVSEEKAQQREEEYKKTIKQLLEKFKSAEGRWVINERWILL